MPVSDYTPTVAEVSALLRARTTDGGGNETGVFSDTSRPRAAQVTKDIQQVVQEVYPKFGQDIPDAIGNEKDALRNTARSVVAMGVAALIEISYFPEQVATNRSPYKLYQERHDKGVEKVSLAIADLAAGDEPGTDDNSQLALSDGLPVDEGGMVGWSTRW